MGLILRSVPVSQLRGHRERRRSALGFCVLASLCGVWTHAAACRRPTSIESLCISIQGHGFSRAEQAALVGIADSLTNSCCCHWRVDLFLIGSSKPFGCICVASRAISLLKSLLRRISRAEKGCNTTVICALDLVNSSNRGVMRPCLDPGLESGYKENDDHRYLFSNNFLLYSQTFQVSIQPRFNRSSSPSSSDTRNMLSFTPKLILTASCFFLHLKSLSAAPVEEVVKVIQVRQEDGDDDGGAITNPLRTG